MATNKEKREPAEGTATMLQKKPKVHTGQATTQNQTEERECDPAVEEPDEPLPEFMTRFAAGRRVVR